MKYTDKQLDELVAEKVMGWELSPTKQVWIKDTVFAGTREKISTARYHPSVNVEQAMQVVEKMIKDRYIETTLVYTDGNWMAEFYRKSIADNANYFDGDEAIDISLPRAICRAALKAVENE